MMFSRDVRLDHAVIRGVGLAGGNLDLIVKIQNPNNFTLQADKLEVGIDVENRSTGRLLAVHDDWLTAAERAALNVLAPEAKGDAAVRFWTLKEAFTKATGTGLYQPFGDVGFKLDPPRFARLPRACAGCWQLAQMCPNPSHVLAVAVRCARRRPVRIEVELLPADTLSGLVK